MSASPASASTSRTSATTTPAAAAAAAAPPPPSSSHQTLDLQLLAAIRDGKGFEQVKSLLDQGARVNAAAFKSNRNTALHYAARYGHASTTQLLLKRGALPNVKNANHWTPLHEAAHRNFEKVVKLLLQHGAQVNTRGMGGYTPLHDAAIQGHAGMCYLLLDHGANASAKNDQHKTVYDVASRGLTATDLHLHRALAPTRQELQEMNKVCQKQQRQLTQLKEWMVQQRKVDFDTLRRETHQVQVLMEKRLAEQAEQHQKELQALRKELLGGSRCSSCSSSSSDSEVNNYANNVRSSSPTPHAEDAEDSSKLEASPEQKATPEQQHISSSGRSTSSVSSSQDEEDEPSVASSNNALNTTTKPKSIELPLQLKKNLEKTPSSSMDSSSKSVPPNRSPSDNSTTATLALQRLVLQRNKDMESMRKEITDTRTSLKKIMQTQIDEKIQLALQQQQQQHSSAEDGDGDSDGGETTVKATKVMIQEALNELEVKQNKAIADLESQLESKQSIELEKLRQELTSARGEDEDNSTSVDELREEIDLLRTEVERWKKEATTATTCSSSSSAVGTADLAADTTNDGSGSSHSRTSSDNEHLKELARKKSEKEEAALSAMQEALITKHQADVETLRGEITASEEHVIALIQQQLAAGVTSSSKSPTTGGSGKAQSSSLGDSSNTLSTDDDTTLYSGDFVTQTQFKKSLHKKTKKQDSNLAALREEFQTLMEFLEQADVGTIRNDITTQMEEQQVLLDELREALQQELGTGKIGSRSKGLQPIPEDGGNDVASLREELAETKDQLNQLAEQQEYVITVLGDEGVVSSTSGTEKAALSKWNLEHVQKKLEKQQTDLAALKKEVNSTKTDLKRLTEQQKQPQSLESSDIASDIPAEAINDVKLNGDQGSDIERLRTELLSIKDVVRKLSDLHEAQSAASPTQLSDSIAAFESKFVDKQIVVELIQEHSVVDEEMLGSVVEEVTDLRELVSHYLMSLKETFKKLETRKVPDEVGGVSGETNSEDSHQQEELERMLDVKKSHSSPTMHEELKKVKTELRMTQSMAERYKEAIQKLYQISGKALA